MRGVILMGSSRSDGDCAQASAVLADQTGFEVIHLKDHDFSDFDYAGANQGDDFIPLLTHIIDSADHIICATPVYWYAMSGIMKRFFDRITDCLTHHKDLGRQLRGKHLGLISISHDVRNAGFETPFELSADYLGVDYLGDVHINVSHPDAHSIEQQLQPLLSQLKHHTNNENNSGRSLR